MDSVKKQKIDKIVSFGILILCVVLITLKKYNKTFLGILLMGINTYMLVKYKKNKLLFFSMLIIWYFNYSYVINRYIGHNTVLLENLYKQLMNYDTIYISIMMQIMFLCIINLSVGEVKQENITENEEKRIDNKDKKILIAIMQVVLIMILIYHLIQGITYNTTLFEYSILLFIFIFYYSKGDKINKVITEIILVLFSVYSILCGERIAVLQFLMVDFIINYLDKFKIKYIISSMIVGIVVFTLAGIYGDFLEYNWDFKDLTLEFIIEKVTERRFALDTSVSAYFSGISMVDVSNKYSNGVRLNNAIEFFFKYNFFGKKANYTTLDILVREYQVNYGGGLPTCYFYFWFGWIGIILISVYIGFLMKTVKKSTQINASTYVKMLAILIVATIPRWYLYSPTMIFRGIMIFSIMYVVMHFVINKSINFIKEKNK